LKEGAIWSLATFIEFTDIEARKHPAPDPVATEDAMPLADGGVVCNCDKP